MSLRRIMALSWRDFTERYSGSILGFGWGVIGPLVNILIYTLIFSQIMNARLPGATGQYSYSIYLVSGLLPWLAFSSAVTRCASVYLDQKHIITKVRVSLPQLPLVIIISETFTFLISLMIFLLILVISGQPISGWLAVLLGLYLAQQVFAYALGFFLAQLTVFIRDLKQLTATVLSVWFWLTPIIYVPDILPDPVAKWMQLNPMFHFTNVWQHVFVHQTLPPIHGAVVVTLASLIVVFVAFRCFKHLERPIRDAL